MSAALAALLAAAAAGPPPREFVRDLRNDEFDFLLAGPEARTFVKPGRDGVRIRLPRAVARTIPPTGFATRIAVRGDFEITLAYQDLDVEKPGSGNGAGVSLYVALQSPEKEAATLSRVLTAKGAHIYGAHRARTHANGYREHEVEEMPARALSGRLRLARRGTTLSYLAAEGDQEFEEVHRCEVGGQDLELVRVAADPGSASTAVAVTCTELRILADEFPESGSGAGRRYIWWIVGAAGAVLTGAGGLWLLRRKPLPRPAVVGNGS